jgi:hypothetical protein
MKIFYLESNPLDEFSVNFYSYTVILNYSFHMNSIYIQLGYIYSLIFCFYVGEFLFKPDIFQYPFELIYKFVFNFFKENSFSIRSSKYFILYLTIFVIILVSNLTGLVHYHKSIMAQFLITFFLAMLVFVFLILVGFILYKIYFYKIIEPENIPKSLFLMNFFFILFLSLNLVGKVNIFKKFIINLFKPFLFNRDLLFFTLILTLFFFF